MKAKEIDALKKIIEVIQAHGYNVQEIASERKYSKTTFYVHFSTCDESGHQGEVQNE